MITIRQFIQQLSHLDQNLPVLIRMDTFIAAALPSKAGAHSGWEHYPAFSYREAINAEDVDAVWDRSTNSFSLEISGCQFVLPVSPSLTLLDEDRLLRLSPPDVNSNNGPE
jgi:hypothetical protein